MKPKFLAILLFALFAVLAPQAEKSARTKARATRVDKNFFTFPFITKSSFQHSHI